MHASSLMVMLLGVFLMVFSLTGCSITPDQGKVIAQNAGLYSAVIWIATDNPTTEQKTLVGNVLDMIKTNAVSVKEGQTYSAVVYPEVEKFINEMVKEQDRPLSKAAAITFVNYPRLKTGACN